MDNRYIHDSYTVRRKVLKLFGGAFHIYDPDGNVVLFASMKAFKLKEDIRLFSGEDMAEELIVIKARNVIDFSATYDIFDSKTNERVGALKRKGLKSILKDEWIVIDEHENEIGIISEDNAVLAMVRRFIFNLIPQKYDCRVNGKDVCTFSQNMNPFVMKVTVDFTPDRDKEFDKRVGIAAALLLCAIEGRQS
ncbi:MAG: hypothetical protein GX660_09020 [Clostridiaceae bacterium]|nr:hypothetical protein [Clostridiaceae bacterium]